MHVLTICLLALLAITGTYAITATVQRAQAKQATHINPLAFELADLLRPTWSRVHAGILATGVPTMDGTATANDQLKDKLRRVEADLSEARDERARLAAARDQARETFAGAESLSRDSDEFKQAEQAVRELGACEDRIADLTAVQVATLQMLGEAPPQARPGHDRPAGDPTDPRWNSDALVRDEGIRAALTHAATSKSRMGGLELGQVASRDALVQDITGTSNMRRGDYAGIVPQLRRQLRVLDLLPTGTMDNNTLPYTQESGTFDTAAETVEGNIKPEAGVVFTDATATAQTIAHWVKLRKQILSDFAALQSIMDGRLRYGVERRLEAEVLAGDGTDPNIRGILNTTGLGAVAFDAAELIADQVLRGVTNVLMADGEADGIVMNPLDWQEVLIARAPGDGHYFSGGPFSMTPQQMWGVPLIPSRAIPAGTALVGDFAIGAQLFIREGVNVLLSDSDQDDFIRNRVTMLAEMRAALAVFRPAVFSTVDLAA